MNSKDLEFVSGKLGVKIMHTAVEIAQAFRDFNNSEYDAHEGRFYDNNYGKFWIFGRSIMFLTKTEVLLFNKLGDKRPIVRVKLPGDFSNLISDYAYKNILIPFGAKICEEYNKKYDKFKQ